MINIKGINKAKILAALYNRSVPQGLGILQASPGLMTEEQASELLAKEDYFDYLKGRVMKIYLPADAEELDPRLYDRDLGQGAAEEIINKLREQ